MAESTAVAQAPAQNAGSTLISRFREEYEAALNDARISEEHTATEGWQRLYQDQREQDRTIRRDMAKRLRLIADQLETVGLGDDEEKALKEVAKESSEQRGVMAVFESKAIQQVCAPVRACERIVNNFISLAERQERDAPLHNSGIAKKMREAIADQPRPKFDRETGQVTIREP